MAFAAVCEWFFYFMVYSVVGWMVETVYCSVIQRKFVERGFLNGPLCPIYGFGAVIVLWVLRPFWGSIGHVFFLGMLLTTVLEYLTSYGMEKLFHMRWWDYSQFKLQINGRVCLLNSVLFGVLCVFLTQVLHPLVQRLTGKFPTAVLTAVCIMLFGMLMTDTVLSVRSVLNLRQRLEQLEALEQELKARVKADLEGKKQDVEQRLAAQHARLREKEREVLDTLREKGRIPALPHPLRPAAELRERIAALQSAQGRGELRLLRAFPGLRSKAYDSPLRKLRARLEKAGRK